MGALVAFVLGAGVLVVGLYILLGAVHLMRLGRAH